MKNTVPNNHYFSDQFKVVIAKVVLVIFLVEALLMLLLPLLGVVSVYQEALLDATMLTLISSPIIYLWVIRQYVISKNLIGKQAQPESASTYADLKTPAETNRNKAGSSSNFPAEQIPEYEIEHGYLRNLITSWLQEWHEKRFAVATSRELLALYREIKADHPELSDREHFNLLIMARNHWDEIEAYEVLKAADQSFAAWPVARELTLGDVIHYQVFLEFMARRDVMQCTHINFESEINSVIPSDLCKTKLYTPYLAERRRTARRMKEKISASGVGDQYCAIGNIGMADRLSAPR